jgi:hypothetical protein
MRPTAPRAACGTLQERRIYTAFTSDDEALQTSIPITNRSVCFTPISQSFADLLQDEMKRETM